MKKYLLLILLLLTTVILMGSSPSGTNAPLPEEYVRNLYKARVTELLSRVEHTDGTIVEVANIEILNRDKKGQTAQITNTRTGDSRYDFVLNAGTLISVNLIEENGTEAFYLIGYERTNYVLQIALIFLIGLALLGGKKGLKAILSLAIVIMLIVAVLVPLLLKGYSPILLSILVCILSTLITLIIISGFNKKSFSAIIGTTGGLIIGGFIAYLYGILARLTGFSSADAQMLAYLPIQINFDYRGLLFAGIIIGALGATMDVSISIASSMQEIRNKNPQIDFKNLFKSGMNIGKDIMGTMTNTLILAYTGAALSTMIIFIGFEMSLYQIINLDSMATEIVRAITGSIGLLCSIPLTALAYVWLNKKQKNK